MKRYAIAIATAVCIGAFSGQAWGLSYTWTGGGDGSTWTDGRNWGGAAVGDPSPTTGDTANFTSGSTNTVNLTGAIACDSITINDSSAILTFAPTVAVTNVTASAGIATFSSTLTVSGTIADDTTITINGAISGDPAISGSGTLDATGSSSTLAIGSITGVAFTASSGATTVGGAFTPGTFAANGGTVNLSGNANVSGLTFATLNITGGTRAVTAGTLTATTLNISGASTILDLQTFALSVTGAAIANAGTVKLDGSQSVTLSGGNDTSQGTWEYYGAGTPTINAFSGYYNLTVNGSGTFSAGGTIDVNHDLTLSAGAFAAAGNAVNVKGSFLNGGGSFTSSGTLTFDGSGTQTFQPSGSSFVNITINAGGSVAPDADPAPSGTLSLQAGTLAVSTGYLSAGILEFLGGTLNATAALDLRMDALTYTSGSLARSSTISVSQFTGTTTIGVGGGSGLILTSGFLSAIGGTGIVTIGRSDSSAETTVAASTSVAYPLALTTNGAADSIKVDAPLATSGAYAIDFKAPVRLGANVTSSNGAITFEQAVNVVDASNPSVSSSGGTITFNAAATINAQSATSADLTVNAGTGTLSLNGGAIGGTYSLINATLTGSGGAVALPAITATGNLSITSGAAGISGASKLDITGNSSFTVGSGGDISLNNAANIFNGTLTFAASSGSVANLTVVDTTAVAMQALTVTGAMSVTAGGAITQSGALGGASLAAKTLNDSGANISLGTANSFGSVSLLALKIDNSTNAAGTIVYAGSAGYGIAAAGIHTASTATLSVGGNVTQTGTIEATALTLGTSAAANFTLNSTSNAITSLAESGTLQGSVSVADTDGFSVGTLNTTGTASGAVTLNAYSGSITLNGNISTDGGTITFDCPVILNADVVLDTASSAATAGNVVFNSSLTAAAAHSLSIDASATTRGSVTLGAANTNLTTLTVTCGSLTLNGAIATTGDQSYNTTGAVSNGNAMNGNKLTVLITNATAQAISLGTATNVFTTIDLKTTTDGSTAANAAVSYKDFDGIDIAGLATAGTATITAGGAITGSAAVTAGTLSASSDGGFSLTSTSNAITNFTASNTASGDISLTNGSAISIAAGGVGNPGRAVTIDTSGTGTITSSVSPAITADTINLQTDAGTGMIGSSSAAPLYTSAATINLGQGSSLAGTYISNTGALSVSTLSLASSASNPPLWIEASGTLGMPAAGINTGSAILHLVSGGAFATNGTLTTTGTLDLTANGGTLGLGDSVSGGTVTLDATGAITQTAAVSGTTLSAKTRNDSGAAITLTQANNFTNVSLRALKSDNSTNAPGAIAYTDNDGFDVSANGIRTTSSATLTAGGNVTQSGTVLASGLALLGSGSYTLSGSNAVSKIAANTGTIDYHDTGALSVDTVNGTTVLTSSGSITLSSSAAISQANAITATSLSTTSVGGTSLASVSNAVPSFTASNSSGGAINLLSSATTLTLAAGGVTQSGTAGAIGIACSGTSGIVNNGTVASAGGAVTLTADAMDLLVGTINSGAGAVTLKTNGAGISIDVGGADVASTTLGLLDTELNRIITTTGLLTIGDSTAHTALLKVSAAVAPGSAAGGLALENYSGNIDINASVTSAAGLTLNTAGGYINRSNDTGTLTATGSNNLTLSAKTGIGSISGPHSVLIAVPSGTFSATNNTGTSGDIFISTTGNVTIGTGTFGITQWNGGDVRVDSGGTITIGAAMNIGTGTLTLGPNGTLSGTGFTLTAGTVNLGNGSATTIGASGSAINTATANLYARASGDIYLSNAASTTLDVRSSGGLVDIANTTGTTAIAAAGVSSTTSSVAITSNSTTAVTAGTVTAGTTVGITSTGTLSASKDITGPSGVTLTVTGAGNSINQTAGTISASSGTVALTADDMALGGTAISGTAVTVKPETTGNPMYLGVNTALGLTNTEIGIISGPLTVGGAGVSGAINVDGAISPTGNLTLTTTGAVSGAGAISGGGIVLAVNAGTGISLSGASTVQTVSLSNSTSGAVSYTNSNVGSGNILSIAASNSGSGVTLTETSGSLAIASGGVSAASGNIAITDSASGEIITQAASRTINATSGAIAISADDMSLGASITANGNIALYPATAGRAINIGGAATALQLTDTEINYLSPGGTITIGDAINTGTITVGGAATLSSTKTVTLRTSAYDIAVNAALAKTTGALTLQSTGGAITDNGSGSLAAGGALTIDGYSGIGVIAGTSPIHVGSIGGLTASNANSGDVFISSTVAGSISLGGAFGVSNSNAAGKLRVDAAGPIAIAGAVFVGAYNGTGTIILNPTGTLTGSASTLTAGSVALGLNGNATGIGASGALIQAATSNLAAQSTGGAQGVYVNSTAAAALSIGYSSTGLATTGGNGPITLTAAGDVTVSQAISANGSGAVNLTATAASTILAIGAQSIASGSGNVTLQFDSITRSSGTISAGTANAYLLPYSAAAVSLGGVETFNLTGADLSAITAAAIYIGRNSVPATTASSITIGATAAVGAAGKVLYLYSTGAIEGNATNAITCSTLNLNAASGIGDTTAINSAASTIAFNNADSTATQISNASTGGLSLSGASAGGAVTITETSGNAVTVNASIATSGGALTLVADSMAFTGTITTVAGAINLRSNTVSRPTYIGSTVASSLSLTTGDLANIATTTTGTLTIGSASTAYTGDIHVNAATTFAVTGPRGAVVLATDGGTIDIGAGITTYASASAALTLNARPVAGTNTGIVSGSGLITAGNAGNSTLTVTAGNGITLNNATGNSAATVTLTNYGNGSASNITYIHNRIVSISAANTATDGTVSLTDKTGAMTVTGASTSGTGAANIVLANTAAGIVISGAVTAAGTGYVSITSAGTVTQSAAITAADLELIGAGSFDLSTSTNVVSGKLAAATSGFVNFYNNAGFTVGTANSTTGIDTTGATGGYVTLNAAAGSITIAADMKTDGGNVSVQRPAILSVAAVTVDTDKTGGTANAGSISFTNTVSGSCDLTTDATSDTGTNSTVSFGNTVGTGTALTSLTAKGTTVTFGGNVTTTGNQTVTATTIQTNGIHDSTASNGNIDFGSTTTTTTTLQAATTLRSGAGTIKAGNISQSGSQTLTLGSAAQTGAISVYGTVTLDGLTTIAGNYDILLNRATASGTSSIATAVTFHNTGALQIGNVAGDSFTFALGVTKTTSGTRTLAGTIAATNSAIDFNTAGDIVLQDTTVLNPGSGQIDLYAMTTAGTKNLDIRGSGLANIGSSGNNFLLGTGTLVLSSKSAGSGVVMDGTTVTLAGITPPAAATNFPITINADIFTATSAVILTNAGLTTLGNADTDIFNFNSGLTKTGTYAAHIRGTIDTSSAPGAISLGTTGGIVLYGAATLKPGTSTITLGATTCDVAAGHNLALYGSTGTVSISSADLGTGGTFDLSNRSGTGSITLTGSLTANAITVPGSATAFALTLNGGSVTSNVDLTKQTGTLTINSSGFTFTGGATKTVNNITLAGGSVLATSTNDLNFGTSGTITVSATTTLGGTSAAAMGTITLSTVVLNSGVTFNLGSGVENNTYTISGTVNGAAANNGTLVVNTAGTSGSVAFNAAVGTTTISALTVTNSYGVTFSNTVGVSGAVTLTNTASGQTIEFDGALTAGSLTAGANAFNIKFNAAAGAQTSTISGNVSLPTTGGTITIGNNAGDILTASGTVNSSGAASRHLIGKIRSAAGTITLGASTLDGDTTIDSTNFGGFLAGATISLAAISDGASSSLVINAGTSGGFTQSAGTITATNLRIIANGSIGTAMATPVSTTASYIEAQSYSGTIFLSNSIAFTVGYSLGDFETTGSLSASAGMITSGANSIGLSAAAGCDITFDQSTTAGASGSFTATAHSLAVYNTANGTITANGGINLYPNADGLGIALSDGTGAFSLTLAELTHLTSSGTLTIGLTGGTGSGNVIRIGSSAQAALGSMAYNLTLQSLNSNLVFTGGTAPVLALNSNKTLTIALGTGTITGSGVQDISLPSTGILNITSAGAIGTGTGTNALQTAITQLHIAASGAVYINQTGNLQLGSAGGNIANTGGLIDIAATGNFTTLASTPIVTSSANNGSVKIASSSGSVTLTGSVTSSGTGTTPVEIDGNTGVDLQANVSAANSATVTIASSTGAVTRSTGAGTVSTGGILALSAGTNIGTSLLNISTAVATLRATASAGGVFITETDGIALGDGSGGISATSGNIAISAGGAVTTGNTIQTLTSGNIAIAAGAATTLTLSNTLSCAGATVGFTGPAGITVNGSAAITGGTGTMTFNNAVTHSAGTIADGSGGALFSGSYDASGGGTLNGNVGTDPNIEFDGATVTFGTFAHNSDHIVFGLAAAQTFNANSQPLAAVAVNKTGGSVTLASAATQFASAAALSFACTGATAFNLAGFAWTLGAACDVNSNVTFNAIAIASTLDGAKDLTVSGTGSFNHSLGTLVLASLTYSSSSASTLGTGPITVSGQLKVSSGTLTQSGDNGANVQQLGSVLVNGGTLAWASGNTGGTLTLGSGDLAASSGTLTLANKTIAAGTIHVTGSAAFDMGSSAVTLSSGAANAINTSGTLTGGTSGLTLSGASSSLTLDDSQRIGDLTVNATGVGLTDSGSVVDFTTLTVNNGMDATITSGGTLTSSGATTLAGALNGNGSANYTSGAALAVNGTGSISMGTGTLTVSAGGMTLNGTGTVDSGGTGTNAISVTGNLAWIGSSSNLNLSAAGKLNVTGNLTQNAASTGIVSITGTGGISVGGNLTQNGSSNGNISSSGPVAVTGQLTNYAVLTVTGANLTVSGAGANANHGTIQTATSGTQTYTGTMDNYGIITGYGLATFTGAVTNEATGTINAGPVATGSNALLFSGNYVSNAAGVLNGNGTTDPNIEFDGATVSFGTFNHNSDKIVFGLAAAQTFTVNSQPLAAVAVNKTGGSVTLASAASQALSGGALSFACTGNTDFNLAGFAWTLDAACDVNSNVTFKANPGTINGTKDLTVSGTGTFLHTTGTLDLASLTYTSSSAASTLGTGPITVSGQLKVSSGTLTQSGDNGANVQQLGSVLVTGGSLVWDSGNAGGSLAVTTALAASGGSLDLGNKTITAATMAVSGTANLVLDSAQITLSSAPNAISTSGTISDTASLLTLTGSGSLTLDADYSIGKLTVSDDTVLIGGGLTKDILIDAGKYLDLDGNANAVSLKLLAGTTLTANGTLRVTDSTHTVALASQTAGSTFTYAGPTDIAYNGKALSITDMDAAAVSTTIDAAAAVTANSTVRFAGIALNGTLALNASAHLYCTTLTGAAGSAVANSGANTITASGSVSLAGAFGTPANSTLAMTGAGTTLYSANQIGNLTVGAAASVTLATADLSMAGNMIIASGGILDASASNYNITIAGTVWNNGTGSTGFVPETGTVTFTNASGPIYIYNDNQWHNVTCTVAGMEFRFENDKTQKFISNGTFKLTGTSSSYITITRQTGTDGADIDWVPTSGAPDQTKMWLINVTTGATIEFTYVTIKYSDASARPLVVPDNVTTYKVTPDMSLANEVGNTCYKWLPAFQVLYSYTEDSDGNGKMDRIRVQCSAGILVTSTMFSNFAVTVTGYDINTSKSGATNGFSLGTSATTNDSIYIWIKEKNYPDGNATPSWTITANTTVRDAPNSGKYALTQDAGVSQPVDTMAPLAAYALTLPTGSQTYVRFSEPVYNASYGAVDASLFNTGSVGVTGLAALTSSGAGTSEALLTLSSAQSALALTSGPTFGLTSTINDDASNTLTDYSTGAYLGLSLPAPYFPTGWGNYAGYSPASVSGLAPPNQVHYSHLTHRVSDVLISIPPATAADSTYFAWPIWMKDSVATAVASTDYESLTAAQTANQTIGLVRDFTGTQWLRAQDLTLEARVGSTLSGLTGLRLAFDNGVSSAYLATTSNMASANVSPGLWLPTFTESSFSGLVPIPDTADASAAGTQTGQLWDFSLPTSSGKMSSGTRLDFFFTYSASGAAAPLYIARLDIDPGATVPTDWYKEVRPFSVEIHDVTKQRSNATILNNVINPNNGELTRLSYQLTKGGRTTISVFTLDGALVKVLFRGTRSAGDYVATWDGKNNGGRQVARGLYFIRIVAPDIDEIRKVMVVK